MPSLRLVLTVLAVFFQVTAYSQLLWPLTFPAVPSGSFGEFRGNHLHAGIDLKTGGQISWPVRAASDGYVSRVKISSGGYGKAIYITHPEGITTVYGHLSEFYTELAAEVHKRQHGTRQFELEFFPDSNQFRVHRGQLIGFTGNTGSSNGPHLHFETRHSGSEKPFDPFFAGVGYADTIPPAITKLRIYEPGPFGWLYESNSIEMTGNAPGEKTTTVTTSLSSCFVGITLGDKANGSESTLGIKEIKINANDSLVFHCRIDSFGFDESPFVKAMVDPLHPGTLLCLDLPGNHLPFFKRGTGIIELPDWKDLNLQIIVTDNYGNSTTREAHLFVISSPAYRMAEPKLKNDHGYELYEPIPVVFREKGKKLGKRITISPEQVVFKKPATLTFPKLKKLKVPIEKLVFGKLQKDGSLAVSSSRIENDVLVAKVSSGGMYGLGIDTVAPKAGLLAFTGYDLNGNLLFEIQFQESISGLRSTEAMIGNDWLLSEFYTNRNVVIVSVPSEKMNGIKALKLNLTDRCGNRSEAEYLIEKPKGISGQ